MLIARSIRQTDVDQRRPHVGRCPQHLQGLRGRSGLKHPETGVLERIHREYAHQQLVFDHENRGCSRCVVGIHDLTGGLTQGRIVRVGASVLQARDSRRIGNLSATPSIEPVTPRYGAGRHTYNL
jgi:hypothetical protein